MAAKLPAAFAVAILSFSAVAAAQAPDAQRESIDGCTKFTWNVTHELAVMKLTSRPLTAAARPGATVPTLEIDEPYDVKLTPQSEVAFAAAPGKPQLADGAQAGLIRFRVPKAGNYRVAMTSAHWIDVVDGTQLIRSRDFQGQRGCELVHKLVEFSLPADRELTLQLSGATEAQIRIAITSVTP